MVNETILIIGSYLFGSISFLRLFALLKGYRVAPEDDLHQVVWKKVGRLWGLTGIILDICKGIFPVVIGFLLQFPLWATCLSGLTGAAGQMWPVFNKFNGEKGNTVGFGILLALSVLYNAMPVFLAALVPGLTGVFIRTIPRFMKPGESLNQKLEFGGPYSNSVPLGMLGLFLTAPIASAITRQPSEITVSLSVLFLMIVVRRLTANITADLGKGEIVPILVNRLFLDRSFK